MFQDDNLKTYLETSQTVKSKAMIVAEWNMNDPENIDKIGNYRYRRLLPNGPYNNLISWYDDDDNGYWYTNATSADVEIAGPYDDNNEPTVFIEEDLRWKLLYSLDDCFKPHRPRSGINYPLLLSGRYLSGAPASANRPRYYLSDYRNTFKYWTSFRREGNSERGISKTNSLDGTFYIDDAVPFVIYKNSIPTNKIVVKMQTNIGTENLGTIRTPAGNIPDPMYGRANATTPKRWDIQVLKGTSWTTAKSFGQGEVRSDGTPIVGPDGYVELTYGILIPEQYEMATRYKGTLTTPTLLPDDGYLGDYYYVVSNEDELGSVYIWTEDGEWGAFIPDYGWKLNEDDESYVGQHLLTDFVDPVSYVQGGQTKYREFEYIDGIRVVVHTMNKRDCPFDLIELSPRLQADISGRTVSVNAKKTTGKVDETALPVGGLEAGTGSIEIFDYDYAFRENNEESIISDHLQQNITFTFYELIEDGITNYFVPIKTLHSEGKAPSYNDVCTVNYELRDSFYIFENQPAPDVMLTEVSLSYAVSMLLDSVGFSNYVFYRDETKPEPTIPFFFVAPDQNVAEVLEKLAKATQSAMFFDEYNNFVVMYKQYFMPTPSLRDTDIVLDGDSATPNIAEIASEEKKVYNAGTINYTERYIQRSIGSLSQAAMVNADQSWIYKPSLLWEVSGTEKTTSVNEKVSDQSAYSLGAMPLDTTLSATVPFVRNRVIVNNVIDVGDNVYWLPRFEGYLYANGEIIKFDAVEYHIQGTGTEWISSNDEYQKYFSTLPFNGKMYPTGLIRIFAEPIYTNINNVEYLENGPVAKHGRGQFGTQITSHQAGIGEIWITDERVRGIYMASEYLFDGLTAPATSVGKAGTVNQHAVASGRNGIIKNHFRDVNYTEAQIQNFETTRAGTIQSSALVFNGPPLSSATPRDWLTYVYKPFETDVGVAQKFKHFGTRMRIIGKLEAAADVDQAPVGNTPIYSTVVDGEALVLNGGSGGIGIGVNPSTNVGYYFELIALTNTNLEDVSGSDDEVGAHNVVFYKVVRNSAATADSAKAIPIKLWGGLADVLVDSGTFAGQGRMSGEEETTVYDLSVEYEDFPASRRFYLFINGQLVATVDDSRPIPLYSSMCLFVRGSSKVMFENVFALRQAVTKNTNGRVVADATLSDAFGVDKVSTVDFRRFGISGIVQKTFLSGVSNGSPNSFNMYYDEFGTIMRECSYFNIKYDKAYPALYATVSPTLNDVPGYRVSGFKAGAYGAQFLVFNVMDKTINLDETSGNYLRIQGIAFTQDTTHEYTMDDYFNEASKLSDPDISDSGAILKSPRTAEDRYQTIKISRMKYGKSEWSLESDYIQTQASAKNLMEWLSSKTSRPRQLIGVEVFDNPMIQLGDVATVSYSEGGIDKVTPANRRFVVYNIEYTRDSEGPKTTLYLSEV